jgi:amino acid adenylation domain-containing protein
MSDLARRIAELAPDQRLRLAERLAARRSDEVALEHEERDSGDFPLSYAQERLWFLDQLAPGSTAYNLSFARSLGFEVDPSALDLALSRLVARHESLRTSFPMVDDEPVQRVAPAAEVDCPVVDLRRVRPRRRRAEVERIAAAMANTPFDLASGPLFRSLLVQIGDPGDVFVLVIHHIVADGWSLDILFRELAALYGDALIGGRSSLPPPGPQYADYTVWQRRRLTGATLDRLVEHWRWALDGAATLDLPTDRPRPPVQSFRGAELFFDMDRATVEALRDVGRRAHATPFMVLLAAFVALLHAYTGQDDIVVGTPTASRDRAELEGIVGFFANNLVLRSDAGGNPSFVELVRRTRAMTIDAYDHQVLPFSKLVSSLRPGHDLSRNPLFQVSFQLLSSHQAGGGGSSRRPMGAEIRFERGSAIFDLALNLAESGSSVRGQIEYSTELFETATIEAMRDHFLALVGNAAAAPDKPIGELELLSAEEHEQLRRWGTGPVHPIGDDVATLFERQARRNPARLAVSDADRHLTYAELDERAERLAALVGRRVGRGGRVATLMAPTVGLVTAILAVLKSGNAFVPIERQLPGARIRSMLDDAGVSLVLARSSAEVAPLDLGVDVAEVGDVGEPGEPPGAGGRGARPVESTEPAYVMFTSGSTGRPKGIVVSRRSLANYVGWCVETYPADGDGAPLATTIGSDMAITSLFVPLVTGKTVFLLDDADPVEALDRALRGAVTFSFVKLTPSHLYALRNLSLGRSVPTGTRAFVVGGEALRGEALAPWREAAPELLIWNEYGPTEATVACCGYVSTAGAIGDGPVPIGTPTANTTVDVVDGHGRRVPVGVTGELLVGGAGLADGYLGNAELTARRFGPPGRRRYRTGDLVRFRRDGMIEYLGRVDRQLKIRGHRVEPGEIETVICRHPAVDRCVVTAQDVAADDRRLVARVVCAAGADTDGLASELAALVRRELPAPMIPSRFVLVAELPHSASGKTDVAALEAVDAVAPGGEVITARTSLERLLLTVFGDVLILDDDLGVHGDFFAAGGGDSLLATKVVARLREFLAADIPLRLLFEHPTAAALADALAGDAGDPAILEERARLVLEVLELSDDEAGAQLHDELHPAAGEEA